MEPAFAKLQKTRGSVCVLSGKYMILLSAFTMKTQEAKSKEYRPIVFSGRGGAQRP